MAATKPNKWRRLRGEHVPYGKGQGSIWLSFHDLEGGFDWAAISVVAIFALVMLGIVAVVATGVLH